MVRGYGGGEDFTNRRLPQEERFRSGWVDFPNYLKSEPLPELQEQEVEEAVPSHEAGRYLPFISKASHAALPRERLGQSTFNKERFNGNPRVPLRQLDEERHTEPLPVPQLILPERVMEEEPAILAQKESREEEAFPTFRRQAHQRKNAEEWRAFLQEKPKHKPRFIPSTVPSILKGMPAYEEKVQQKQLPPVDYTRLEELLLPSPESLLIFEKGNSPREDEKSATLTTEPSQPDTLAPKTTPISRRPNLKKESAFQSTYQPALQKPLLKAEEAVQESFLQTQQAPQEPRQPLPGKQRRAMNRSLSWIMEQEQKNQEIPYV